MIVIKKLKYLFFSFFSLLFVTTIHAQKLNSIEINFNPLFQKSSLVKDSNYIIEKDSFQISQCKFYISATWLTQALCIHFLFQSFQIIFQIQQNVV